MIKIVHVITGLEVGGVQAILYRLVNAMDRTQIRHEVIALTPGGETRVLLEQTGIPVTDLGMRPGTPDPRGLWRLGKELHQRKPDIVQSWMYHSDLMGGLAATMASRPGIIWGIHNECVRSGQVPWHTRLAARVCAFLSNRIPDKIVCVSESGRRWHIQFGYSEKRMIVIPNGVDTDLFRPDPEAGRSIRREFGLAPEAVVVGHVGRFDPRKDHQSFVEAAARVLQRHPNAQFLMCGSNIDADNEQLNHWIRATGRPERFGLLGVRGDIERVLAAIDILALSSTTEASPNCVGEAMACEVPAVSTNVGDLPEIVADTGVLVPPKDPAALAGALSGLMQAKELRRSLGKSARRRIEQHFGFAQMVKAYEACYQSIVGAPNGTADQSLCRE